MEHMSAEIQQLRDQRMLEIQRVEREWYDSQTKRMEVEGKVMMTDTQLQAAVRENLLMMMQAGTQEAMETGDELEAMEAQAMTQPEQQAAGGARPQQPAARGAGSMTRQPDVNALSGESKPVQP